MLSIQLPWAFLPQQFEEIVPHLLYPGIPQVVVEAHPRGMPTKVWLESPLCVCLNLLPQGELVTVLYASPSNIPKSVYVGVEAVNNYSNGPAHFRALQQPPREGKPLVQHVEVTPKSEIRLFHPGIHHAAPSWEFLFYAPSNNPLCAPCALAHAPNVNREV